MSQITGDDALGIAARMVEQGMASVRAEAGAVIAARDARIAELERECDELRDRLDDDPPDLAVVS